MKDPSSRQQAEAMFGSGQGAGVMIGKSTMGPHGGSVLLWQSVAASTPALLHVNAGPATSGLALTP